MRLRPSTKRSEACRHQNINLGQEIRTHPAKDYNKTAMKSPLSIFLSVAALLAAPVILQAQTPTAKSTAKKAWTTPRTPDGHPELEGIWTNATITRMERLPEFNGKLDLTDAEAAAFEKKDHQESEEEPGKDGVILGGVKFSGANAGYNELFIDRGSRARARGRKKAQLADHRSAGWQGSSARCRAPATFWAWTRRRGRLRRIRQREEPPHFGAMPAGVRLHVRAAHDARAVQQQLSDRRRLPTR